jgi:predicted GNAT family N-acyltransferase
VNGKKPQSRLQIEPLSKVHDREGFVCGVAELDSYIRQQAGQDLRRNLAAIFVLTPNGRQIAGYYTLSAHSLNARDLPGPVGKRLPRFPLPVTLLGRMAVSEAFRGQGLGKFLLMDALERAWLSSRQIASWAVVVDAKAGAREFYLKYQFMPLPCNPDRLFLPMASIEELTRG